MSGRLAVGPLTVDQLLPQAALPDKGQAKDGSWYSLCSFRRVRRRKSTLPRTYEALCRCLQPLASTGGEVVF